MRQALTDFVARSCQITGRDQREVSFFDSVRTGQPPAVGAKEGRDATLFGLLVRKAVYEKRVVTMDEILAST